jgi:hypothetical protein
MVRAQVNRSFVSTNGSSANVATNCQKPAPCRFWNEGLAVTNAGGEIVALDSGGFGSATVTKSIVLIGHAVEAGFLVPSGTSGVTVNAPGSIVILRELEFTGNGGSTNTIGLNVITGTVVVDRCKFRFLSSALLASGSKITVIESDFHASGIAIDVTGGADLALEKSVLSENTTGINANGSTVRVSRSMITHNAIGLIASNGGALISHGNNSVSGNSTNGAFTAVVGEQ